MDKLKRVGSVNLGESNRSLTPFTISKEIIYTLVFILLLDYVYPVLGFTAQQTGTVLITMAIYIAGLAYINRQHEEEKLKSWKTQRISKKW